MLRLVNVLYSSFYNPYLYNQISVVQKAKVWQTKHRSNCSVVVKTFSTLQTMEEFDINKFFECAKMHVLEAGDLIQSALTKEKDKKNIEIKSSHYDIVTHYDHKVEDVLIGNLSKEFPDHKFLAEESSHKKDLELTEAPTWIIDPIDGTTNFVHGFPFFCISIALAIQKEVMLGIIYNPSTFEMYTAKKEEGAFLNDKPIHASKIIELNKALMGCEPGLLRNTIKNREIKESKMKALINATQGCIAVGSAALTMAYVARGMIDCFQMEGLQPWDIAAGMLIIREAGGVVINSKGGELDLMKPDLVIAANGTLAKEIVNLIQLTLSKIQYKKMQEIGVHTM